MKKINKKDLVLFIVLFFILISTIIFAYNDDFLYKDKIMKITNIETTKEEEFINMLGLKEMHYYKNITGTICNGDEKGSEVTLKYEETYSSVVTDKYDVGDKVFINLNSIIGLKRDFYIVILISLFVLSIFIVGKYRGLFAIVIVILNTLIFYYGLNLYFKGLNLLFLCMIESILFIVLSLLIASGKNKKTLVAIISAFLTTLILLLITLVIVKFTNYSGISFNGMSFLTVPVEDVFLAELMIGAVGAIMDVSITISSSMCELVQHDKDISIKALKKSGKEIGKDIMCTMINVLFFTYLCSGLPLFVLAIRNGFTMYNYITTNFSLELTRFLIGSIGIVLAILVACYISIKLFKRGGDYE